MKKDTTFICGYYQNILNKVHQKHAEIIRKRHAEEPHKNFVKIIYSRGYALIYLTSSLEDL